MRWIAKDPKMMQIQFPELRGSLNGVKYPAFAEIKYDGELNYIHYFKGHATRTINKYGNMREDFPVLNNITQAIKSSTKDDDIKAVTLVGELYWGEGKKGALYDLLSHKKDDNVQLKLFDIIGYNETIMKGFPLIDRREFMYGLGLKEFLVPTSVVQDKFDAEQSFKAATKCDWEGIVVKGLDSKYNNGPCAWVKLKGKDQTDYVVVSIDPIRERIGIGAPIPNSTDMIEVGVKAPNRYKKHIAIGDVLTIEHQGILPSGSLRHPVLIKKPEWP